MYFLFNFIYMTLFITHDTLAIYVNFYIIIIIIIIIVTIIITTTNWKKVTNKLPANIFRFRWRYLVFSLVNNSNLHRWKISNNGLCSLCNKLQTQLHVFNNCRQTLDHYSWRHNSILFTIAEHLKLKLAIIVFMYMSTLYTLDFHHHRDYFLEKYQILSYNKERN